MLQYPMWRKCHLKSLNKRNILVLQCHVEQYTKYWNSFIQQAKIWIKRNNVFWLTRQWVTLVLTWKKSSAHVETELLKLCAYKAKSYKILCLQSAKQRFGTAGSSVPLTKVWLTLRGSVNRLNHHHWSVENHNEVKTTASHMPLIYGLKMSFLNSRSAFQGMSVNYGKLHCMGKAGRDLLVKALLICGKLWICFMVLKLQINQTNFIWLGMEFYYYI